MKDRVYKIDIIGLKELMADVAKLPARLKTETEAAIRDGAQVFVRNAKRDAPRDMGVLANFISSQKVGDMQYEVASASKYSAYLEFGTKTKFQPIAGVDASQFKGKGGSGGMDDFFLAILEWVKRKGLADTYSTGIKKNKGGGYRLDIQEGKRKKANDVQAYDLAFVIMMGILKKGIKPQPFFFKQRHLVIKQIEDEVKAIVNSVKL